MSNARVVIAIPFEPFPTPRKDMALEADLGNEVNGARVGQT